MTKKNNKKELIINAAIELFKTKSINDVTIAEITKAAGMGHGTFYLYFTSKYAIIPDIAILMAENTGLIISDFLAKSGDTLEDKIKALIDAICHSIIKDLDWYSFIFTGLRQVEYLREWEKIYVTVYEVVTAFIDEYRFKGSIRKNIDSVYCAQFLVGLIEFSVESALLYDHLNFSKLEAQKKELNTFILQAIKA